MWFQKLKFSKGLNLVIKSAFGCGKFSSFPGNFFKENENLENTFGSFSFQKFSKKMKILISRITIVMKSKI